MNQQLFGAFIFFTLFLLLVVISYVLHRYFYIASENSRKFLHVTGGFLSLCTPLFFKDFIWVGALCFSAFLLMLVTFLLKWLPSVHQTRRKSIGSILFPIPVFICFFAAKEFNFFLFFYLPVSLLTIADPVAELVGKKWGSISRQLVNKQKTVAGSLGFFLTSLLLCIIWLLVYLNNFTFIIIQLLVIPLVTCFAELLSTKGWDNVTVPLTSLLLLIIFHQIL